MLFLTGVVYQPSSNETEKLVWPENFEHMLSAVYEKWNGDFDLLKNHNVGIKTLYIRFLSVGI